MEGSAEDLTLTRNAQPGLMAVSLAAHRVLAKIAGDQIKPAFVAGHSLGEYSALASADAIGLADIARLLRLRAEAMQRATPAGLGGMAAIIGLDSNALRSVVDAAAEDQVCEIANDNGGGQIVISGHMAALERAMAAAKEKGAKRAVPLSVSAPFHSSLMKPAAEEMAEALAGVPISAPACR